MPNTQLTDFLIELYNRIRTKSPKFFFVLQLLSASVLLLGYLPSALQRWTNIIVSVHFMTFCEDVSKYATGFFGASMLATKTKPTAQTETGEAIKVTDEKKMPFTSKHEAKDVKEIVPPPPVISDVPTP